MPISNEMIVRVAHADVALRMAFPRSIAYWRRRVKRPWKVLAGNCGPLLIGKHDGIVIDGGCSNGVSAPDGGVIHVYGDLASLLDVSGQCEIVITGDVLPHAVIKATGHCHVFAGGRFLGELRSSGSTKLWIDSDFEGIVKTGTPSTEIHIGNDCNGSISPGDKAALLWLMVGGFASHALMSTIVKCGYTQFNASIARSDVPPGIYPVDGRAKSASGGNSFNWWCVGPQLGT